MQNQPIEQTPRKTARMAGLLYLILIIAGIFAQGYVREGLIMAPGDAAATAHNIVAAEGLFRLSIAGDLVMILCDIALGVLFYLLLRPVSNALALMAAFFRLAQAATLGLNLLNLFVALNLAKGVDTLAQFATAQQQALAMLFVNAHSTGYDIALIFFSIYLLLLGYLMTKSSYFPGFLGTMLVVAGVCYLIDSFSFLYPAYAALTGQMMVAPTVLAELTLTLWLLIKGVKAPPQGDNKPLPQSPIEGLAT